MDATHIRNGHAPNPQTASGNGAAIAAGESQKNVGLTAVGRPPKGQASTTSIPKITSEQLNAAVKKLQQNIPKSSSITLEAGLDPNGNHPGQVLIMLSDKATKQIFFKYYVPVQQILKSAATGGTIPPGSLMSEKA
ncbi:hypothetical protein [Acidithiobacillus sp.]|jgi:hypothetical protein|uniref:hypothetical protein n=1 Tax=Acidithiobacillus sp. TaxID=1872118 RepID=UPI0025C14A04|nr:hypothetical protein [Acidithiobacillus sp.]MCK9187597.1 hypothetical protein [Acidithiobacillus sp.]MCK9358487.1 hypothetical protein [Acidithiobacillus sp.]